MVAWALFSVVIFHFLTVNRTLAWLFVFASAVMVIVILVFRRVAERRIRLGLHDAGWPCARSSRSPTRACPSFLSTSCSTSCWPGPGGWWGATWPPSSSWPPTGTSLTVRASYGLDARGDRGPRGPGGRGGRGRGGVAGPGVIVNDVAEATETAPLAAPTGVVARGRAAARGGPGHRRRAGGHRACGTVSKSATSSCSSSWPTAPPPRSNGPGSTRPNAAAARGPSTPASTWPSWPGPATCSPPPSSPTTRPWCGSSTSSSPPSPTGSRSTSSTSRGRCAGWPAGRGPVGRRAARHPHPDGEALVRRVLAGAGPRSSSAPDATVRPTGASPPPPAPTARPSRTRGSSRCWWSRCTCAACRSAP